MAACELERLAREAGERWPLVRTVLLHRIGEVESGEASVAVGVACPHRAEAFEACRWLIDTLKAEVPIWKREALAGGGASWVEG
jgi:molybdopterin synthase catalytic subunit